jgi:ABC-type multidrug transport system fused ATPase/permease subunit
LTIQLRRANILSYRSGKSTILKLISRLYDCTEGAILIDGCDIKDFRMSDLRRAMSGLFSLSALQSARKLCNDAPPVLFQDFSIWPLSIEENIGIGDPTNAHDGDKIKEAARLGGAHDMVARLPDGFDTFLDRPVRDYYSALPQGTKTVFGREVNHARMRGVAGLSSTTSTNLSGGQMQRIAL